MKIDITFDFSNDTPHYWDDFWSDEILGGGRKDPDQYSMVLREYHQKLWSKRLPNGEKMELSTDNKGKYLTWKNFSFGSDSILASFRYVRYRYMLEAVSKSVPDYKAFIENFIHKSYTIGGTIIFPKSNSINRARGCNSYIRDRWDLTVECIRRYYNNEESPLFNTLKENKDFFDLFVDFKGYVDFFYLQDCVANDYNTVQFWIGDGDMYKRPLPQSVDEYLQWISKQNDFLNKRNKRIAEAVNDI